MATHILLLVFRLSPEATVRELWIDLSVAMLKATSINHIDVSTDLPFIGMLTSVDVGQRSDLQVD